MGAAIRRIRPPYQADHACSVDVARRIPTTLDAEALLVYHAQVGGAFAERFEPVDLDAWRARVAEEMGIDVDSVDAVLAFAPVPGLHLPALHTEGSGMPQSIPMRRGRWQVRQQYDDPRMEAVAEQLEADLGAGVEALWFVAGLDHGTRVLTPGDIDIALKPVDFATLPVYLEPRIDALSVAMGWVAVAESRGVAPDALRGGFGADPLGTLAQGGVLASGMRGARRELVELAMFSRARCPGVRAVLVSTSPYHDAGASPTQEIAWAVATAIEYLDWMVNEGIRLEDALYELQFAVSVSSSLFSEIAKLRALRWVWSKALAAAGVDHAHRKMELHVRGSTSSRTRRDVWNNALRATAETFAGAVGGADSIATLPHDVALGASDERSRRLARNVQHVLRDESHLHRVSDPAAWAWAIEALTSAYARQAWSIFQRTQKAGGLAAALTRGMISNALDGLRRERAARVGRRDEVVLGVTHHPALDESAPIVAHVDLEEVEVELGNSFGTATPDQRHEALLAFAQTLRDPEALLGSVADAALAANRLGVDVFSLGTLLRTGRASLFLEPLAPFRPAAAWEALRDASERWAKRHDRAPRAFLATLGDARKHWTRMRDLLACVGIRAVVDEEARSADDAIATMSGLDDIDLAVICGPAERVRDESAELAPALKAKGARLVLVAASVDDEDGLRSRGVDGFLGDGDVLSTLADSLRALGVPS